MRCTGFMPPQRLLQVPYYRPIVQPNPYPTGTMKFEWIVYTELVKTDSDLSVFCVCLHVSHKICHYDWPPNWDMSSPKTHSWGLFVTAGF